ncbi:MAG: ribulose-phosphate 3-epimerase [Caldilineaceae bacterium]|nr:ribulose-phosphate 3-epimerase [Caldilineaceae bacterium]
MIKISASMACADFTRLGAVIEELEEAGIDLLHLDVADNEFAPTVIMGPVVVASLRRVTQLPFDVHMTVWHPLRLIPQFADAGADMITFPVESSDDPATVIREIKGLGMKVGVSFNPETPISALPDELWPEIDLALPLTVPPAFAGGTFQPDVVPKFDGLRTLAQSQRLNFQIEADGHINETTIPTVVNHGADLLVLGSSSIFKPGIDIAQETARLRTLAEANVKAMPG